MTSLLIFIRHSLPEIDPTLPAVRWQLSGEGRRRCQGLADQLASYLPARILSSREPKALQTAQAVASRYGLSVSSVDGLQEHRRQRVPYTDQKRFTSQVAALFAHPDEVVFGEESADQAYARFSAVVDSSIQAGNDQNLVIVTHGTVLALWARRRLAWEPFSFWQSQTMPCILVTDPFEATPPLFIRYNQDADLFTSS